MFFTSSVGQGWNQGPARDVNSESYGRTSLVVRVSRFLGADAQIEVAKRLLVSLCGSRFCFLSAKRGRHARVPRVSPAHLLLGQRGNGNDSFQANLCWTRSFPMRLLHTFKISNWHTDMSRYHLVKQPISKCTVKKIRCYREKHGRGEERIELLDINFFIPSLN